MEANPILASWKQALESRSDLASARQELATQAAAGQITREHVAEAGLFLQGDDARALPPHSRLMLAAVLFQAARSAPSLDEQLRFATALTLWQAVPGGRRDLLRVNVEAAQAALSSAPEDLPDGLRAALLSDLGSSLAQLGDRGTACDRLREALTIYRRLAQAEPAAFEPDVAMTLNNLGTVLGELGDRAGARAAYEEALRLAGRGDSFLQARVMANLAVLLYEEGERRRGLLLARQAVESVETALSDPRYAEVRYSFKGEIENAYRLALCAPEMERDSLTAHRFVQALREGDALAGFAGWRSALLHIQSTHDGMLFLASLASGTVQARADASWTKAARGLLEVVSQALEERGGDWTGDLAAAGHDLWVALPEAVQRLLDSPPAGGIALSLDADSGVLPLEFLTSTGRPEDFLCLKQEMPRVPGERLFAQCMERMVVDGGAEPQALAFGNPWPTRPASPYLRGAEQEAVDVAGDLAASGFMPALDGKRALLCSEAKLEQFIVGLVAGPTVIHFAGHGYTADQEEYLQFAGEGVLSADALTKQVKPWTHSPFVFLNSCWTGRARTYGGAFRGLPIAFLRLGAAAVVASVFPLADVPAWSFARTLYGKLLAGSTVGVALLETRREMAQAREDCLRWGIPILYGNPHARLVIPRRV